MSDAIGLNVPMTICGTPVSESRVERDLRYALESIAELTAALASLTEQVAALRAPVMIPYQRVGAADILAPVYAKEGDSGRDLRADLTFFERIDTSKNDSGMPGPSRGSRWLDERRIQLDCGARISIGCGFAFETPAGKEWQVRPRSGGSTKGVDICFGTVDAFYRGEVTLTVWNNTGWPLTIAHGDRLAQVVLMDVRGSEFVEVDTLAPTVRGDARHGSTGVR